MRTANWESSPDTNHRQPFRQTSWAMFVLGFATFSLLYGTQPLLPLFSAEFQITPAEASGVVSATTIALALLLIPFGTVSDRVGRKPVILGSLLSASLLSLACAAADQFWLVLVLRALTGCALAGVPAVAMAYLSEEIHPDDIARAVGLYFAGNAIGGLSGRLLASALGDWLSWRAALLVIGAIGIGITLFLVYRLPSSQRFQPSDKGLHQALRNIVMHLRNPELLCLFGFAFFLMGIFVSVYNYLGYWLVAPPFNLNPLHAGWIFLFYLLGPPSSIRSALLSNRFGSPRVLAAAIGLQGCGLLLMLALQLPVLVLGLMLFTVGYFVAYSVAGAWVTRSVTQAKAAATSLYLCFFYTGASLIGTGSGLMWSRGAWHGVVYLLVVLVAVLAVLLLLLARQRQKQSALVV